MRTVAKTNNEVTPLPKLATTAVMAIQFNQAFQITMLFPFVVFMVESFSISSESTKGFWVGLLNSVFCLGQFLASYHWGKAADKWGRKNALMTGLIGSMVTSLIFGTSKNYWQAFAGRFLAGLLNGTTPINRALLADLTDKTNRSRGFTLLSLMFGMGCTVGPLVGGLFAEPDVESGLFHTFPYLLPVLVGNGLQLMALIATITGVKSQKQLALEKELIENDAGSDTESLGTSDSCNSYGLAKCDHEESFYCGNCVHRNGVLKVDYDAEEEKFLKHPLGISIPAWWVTVGLAIGTFMYVMFDELVPLLLAEDEENGGLDMSSLEIGLILASGGVVLALYSVFWAHKVLDRIGIIKNLKLCLFALTPIIALMPATQWINNRAGQIALLILVQCLKHIAGTALFVGHFIIINNTIPAKMIGKANGVLASGAAVVSALGPFVGGLLWSLGIALDFDGQTLIPFVGCGFFCFVTATISLAYPKWIEKVYADHILSTLGLNSSRLSTNALAANATSDEKIELEIVGPTGSDDSSDSETDSFVPQEDLEGIEVEDTTSTPRNSIEISPSSPSVDSESE
eukprot:TRINITY_DN2581_c0_g4_i1.p1 TRINITY_DN2581_c0_g4~~TRINITY_DN2581_c0_g4_i1.p1  ORF type:complete len:572 (+),score=197.82 TRINITY_DN2581_c0_g4_i1:87-1802(+)